MSIPVDAVLTLPKRKERTSGREKRKIEEDGRNELSHGGGSSWSSYTREVRFMIMKGDSGPLGIVLGIGNQKGGVGKSTNTVHLATALGERGYTNLIVDLDPSAGSTLHLGVPPKSFAGSFELIVDNENPCELAITENLPQGVHLIPSRGQLAELDKFVSKFTDKTRLLERALILAREHYDFIWLDTPPNPASITTIAAYASAEWFLLSAFPHALSLHGLNEALVDIADVRKERNQKLEILGVLLAAVDKRTKSAVETEKVIAENFPDRAFKSVISAAIALPDASAKGKTLFQMPGLEKHRVLQQYRNLAQEIEHRVLNREAFLSGTLPELPELKPNSTAAQEDFDHQQVSQGQSDTQNQRATVEVEG